MRVRPSSFLPFVIVQLLLLTLLVDAEAMGQTDPQYEVYAISYARAGESFPLSEIALGADSTSVLDINFMIWLLKGSDGKNVLVDSGFLPDSEFKKNYGLPMLDYVRPDQAVARLGISPEDISDIVITHLHWDHADGVGLFPNAQIWIQKAELEYYAGEAWQPEMKHFGVDPRDVVRLVDLNTRGRVTLIDGDAQEIIDGVTVYTGARHTFAGQYLGVETGGETIVLASDNLLAYGSIGFSTIPDLTFDPEADLISQRRMLETASSRELVIPGHDSRIFERFPNPMPGVARIR